MAGNVFLLLMYLYNFAIGLKKKKRKKTIKNCSVFFGSNKEFIFSYAHALTLKHNFIYVLITRYAE